jgi:protein O-mannosyl-transferase
LSPLFVFEMINNHSCENYIFTAGILPGYAASTMKKEPLKKIVLKKDQPKIVQKPGILVFEKYADLAGLFLIIVAGIIIYSNSFGCSFHFDDFPIIINNPKLHDLANVGAWWNFYPSRVIGIFSFVLNYHFNQADPWYYHLVNLVIHLINACLVWVLTLQIFSSPNLINSPVTPHKKSFAFFMALLFVSHPLATQSVTYIWQRIASLVTLFYLVSLILYIKARLSEGPVLTKTLLFAGSLFAAVLAMLTKENAFTLPFAILLVEVFFLRTKKITLNLKDYRMILILAAFTGVILIIPLKFGFSIFKPIPPQYGHAYTITPFNFLFTQFSVIIKYIQLLIIPVNQHLDYDFPVANTFFGLRTIISFLVLLSLLILAVFLFKRNRIFSFGISWFFLTLSVEASFIPLDDMIFEHRTYLPSFGFFLILTTGLYMLFRDKNRYIAVIILTVIAGVNSILAHERNNVWKDDISLWSDNVKKSPNKIRPLFNRAVDYSNMGQSEKAMTDYSMILEIDPEYKDALANRAGLYGKLGLWDKTIEDCSHVIKLDPKNFMAWFNRGDAYENFKQFDKAIADYTKAIAIDPGSAKAYTNRGISYAGMRQFSQALEDCSQAIKLDPGYAQAYYNRAIIYTNLGQWANVISDCSRAIETDPSYVQAYAIRGVAYGNTGQMDRAIEDYTSAIRVAPGYTKAWTNRAVAYGLSGQWEKAIADYSQAIILEPGNANTWFSRGIDYGNVGQWDNAIADFTRAIEIDPNFANAYSAREAAYRQLRGGKTK